MTPAWVKDAFFYQIFPDRFRQGNGPPSVPAPSDSFEPWDQKPTLKGFKGGNLWGVIEKLDYLQDLGVNALYFCPVFASTANHRYHTTDYFQVDPVLGGNQALRQLLDQAHARGMRVVLDGVFNHCGRSHFAFQHVLENGQNSPYLDWFHIHNFPLNAYSARANYTGWWNNPELPKFNTATPAVREYLFAVAEHWLEFGIDGWRLDVANEIDDDSFWQEFRRRVKKIRPDAYIVGEIWDDATRWLKGDQFDAVMNYPLSRAILGFVGGNVINKQLAATSGLKEIETLDAAGVAGQLEAVLSRYPWESVSVQMNLLTSHDTPRLFTLLRGEVARVNLALSLLFVLPGAPTVYYGDETGMEGGHDPDNRRGMVWDESRWQKPIRETIRQMARLRARLPALRRGHYQTMLAQNGQLVFCRGEGKDCLVVAVNASDKPGRLSFQAPPAWPEGCSCTDLVGGKLGVVLEGGLEAADPLPPFSLAVWQAGNR